MESVFYIYHRKVLQHKVSLFFNTIVLAADPIPENNRDQRLSGGTDIGKVIKPIKRGEHLHVHNVKTKRW